MDNFNDGDKIAELQEQVSNLNSKVVEARVNCEEKSKQIAELQERVNSLQEAEHYNADCYANLKDKLHRRNLQIKELKKQVAELEIALTTMQGAYKGLKEEI
jgi:chromosome segregation ATPase